MSDDFFERFILEHDGDDPARLLLSAERWSDVDVRRAARTIEARRKSRGKLPSWYALPGIDYPSSLSLEQCSSEETARYKQSFVPAGGRMADLTGGLGVDCWAMSAAACEAHYVERDPALCAAARHNFVVLGRPDIIVHEGDGPAWLQEQSGRFDLLYLDPARRNKTSRRVYDIAECEPDLLEVKDMLLERANRVLAKISPMADISRTISQLPEIRELHVVAWGGEVKEILLLMEPRPESGSLPAPIIVAADGISRFAFRQEEEQNAEVRYADTVGRYLFQPSKALRKAGAFRLLSARFNLDKLAPSTHLYTADTAVEGFPGKTFTVEAVFPWNNSGIKTLRSRYERLELTALNFPIDTAALRHRLAIPAGGNRHAFATTLSDRGKVVIICA